MTRNEYLKNQWTPYPAKPATARAFGRLLSVGDELVLSRGIQSGEVLRFSRRDLRGEALAHLQAGDLVAVSPEGEMILLAPGEAPASIESVAVLREWGVFQKAVRDFFTERGFVETPTPSLVVCPGTEPSLDVFATEFVSGSRREKKYLPTSPELHLKKLLSRGWEKIFEIKKCFRNGEITEHHQPEFTLIEWYRAWENLESIEQDAVDLIRSLAGPVSVKRVTMAQLFQEKFAVELTPKWGFSDYEKLALAHGWEARSGWSIDDLFFWLFTEKIESRFSREQVMIVTDWPPFQAALARLTPQGWGDRFEIYWRGLELANAFNELNDPNAQRVRFREDLEKKKHLGKELIPLDENFLKALDSGMPPSAGIALGMERLFMAVSGHERIQALSLFPY